MILELIDERKNHTTGINIHNIEDLVCVTRNILKSVLIVDDAPVKNTTKKQCYEVLAVLQKIYNVHSISSNTQFLEEIKRK